MRLRGRRRQVIVDKALQLRIILSISLPMFAILAIATFAQLAYERQVLAGNIAPDGTIFGMPGHRVGMFLLFALASTFQVYMGLSVSHKVAGAAYRVAQTLKEFRGGNHEIRARLRTTDYQTKMADDLNEFLEWVQTEADAPHSGSSVSKSAPGVPSRAQPRVGDGVRTA